MGTQIQAVTIALFTLAGKLSLPRPETHRLTMNRHMFFTIAFFEYGISGLEVPAKPPSFHKVSREGNMPVLRL